MNATAELSPCGTYRYALGREWDESRPSVLFVMLNPSTADAVHDDPTIRRCIGFARDWGYGGLLVGNLYAFRATKPADLPPGSRAVGPENDAWLARLRDRAGLVVAAWGARQSAVRRAMVVKGLLGDLWVLGLTFQGLPRHPLYVPAATQPVRWS